MSEYLYNVDFDALMASAQEPFDFNPLDYSAPIGQSEAPDFDYNATYGFDSGMDFDFNADFGLNPSLPLLPNAAAMTDQS
ncbi:hypothetical protein ANO14919_041990 [Xylariales sp. No.14919]|nr:hypothetical protein ANO14919_041990 [Xylariales sp. No.14919]